jgi:hypothetical protein
MHKKQWAEAVDLWERVVELNPVCGSYWDQLAGARREAHDYRRPSSPIAGPWARRRLSLVDRLQHRLLLRPARREKAGLAVARDVDRHRPAGLQAARDDADLEPLRGEPRFRELVTPLDSAVVAQPGLAPRLETAARVEAHSL